MVLALRACVISGFEISHFCWTTLGWTGTENMTGNSAIADKPRDEFVQINGVGDLLRYAALLMLPCRIWSFCVQEW